MNRLFIRFFLWFWAGSLCVAVVFAVSLAVTQPDVVTNWRFIGRTAMGSVGSQVASAYERDGHERAAAVLQDVTQDGRLPVWVYGADGRLVAGRAPLANAGDIVNRAMASDDFERVVGRDVTLLARSTTSDSGARYVVVWEAPRPLRWASDLRSARLIRLLAPLLASAAICFLLAWHITRPVRALREAARHLGAGELSVRVSDRPELQRKGELSELAGEFDRMADRIEASIRGRQRLLADISHELRSPLARLSLALDLARRRVGEGVPEHDRIATEVSRLDTLIGQLLTLARLESHGDRLQLQDVQVRDLIHEIATDAQFEAEAANRHVVLAHACDATVRGDRSLLRSAIENVVRNAIRHTPAHTTVTIRMEQSGNGRALAVLVQDDGPGVPADALPHLFDPFFRVDDARERSSGGAGLGLAIVRQAMLAHHGRATARNRAEGGLLVTLELPITGGRSRVEAAS